jgi:prepilin-type N-terminal cleavage/methylation domain-containing protein
MAGRMAAMRGFSLVEMAIVLVVIGLVLSGGLLAIAPVIQNTKVADTEARLDRLEQAIILHSIRYGCIPCPANPTLASGNANAGRAQDGPASYYTTGCTANACQQNNQGAVPWINLGISEAEATDGYTVRIDYAITAGLQNANGMMRAPPATYPAGTLVVNTADGTQITGAAAYVLISHGDDRSGGFGASGIAAPDPNGSANQTANTNGTPFVQDTLNGTSGANHFDDIVRWRTAPMIIQLCGTNACGNPA